MSFLNGPGCCLPDGVPGPVIEPRPVLVRPGADAAAVGRGAVPPLLWKLNVLKGLLDLI